MGNPVVAVQPLLYQLAKVMPFSYGEVSAAIFFNLGIQVNKILFSKNFVGASYIFFTRGDNIFEIFFVLHGVYPELVDHECQFLIGVIGRQNYLVLALS